MNNKNMHFLMFTTFFCFLNYTFLDINTKLLKPFARITCSLTFPVLTIKSAETSEITSLLREKLPMCAQKSIW